MCPVIHEILTTIGLREKKTTKNTEDHAEKRITKT
jgi:hypothetical protein